MFFRLFLLFALVPVVELYILIEIGKVIGALNTVLLVILTAFAGAALTRKQGARTILKIKQELASGSMPAGELVDAVLIFAAGIVLITPGILTDIAGFLLLIPPTREMLKKRLYKKFRYWIDNGTFIIR